MCSCLHSHEIYTPLSKVGESVWQLHSDISLEYKRSICNIVPHKLVEILCETHLQVVEEEDHGGLELSNLADVFYDKDSNDREE